MAKGKALSFCRSMSHAKPAEVKNKQISFDYVNRLGTPAQATAPAVSFQEAIVVASWSSDTSVL